MKNLNNNKVEFDKYIKELYNVYPMINNVSVDINLIRENIIFKEFWSNEYLNMPTETCAGFIFVLDGVINIHKVNEDGEETYLYDLKKGDICHEAISCFLKCKSLQILAKAKQHSRVAIIPSQIVTNYLLEDVNFFKGAYQDLYKKFTLVVNSKESKVHESLQNRLVKLLIEKQSKIIYITHSSLAFELDSSREVVSRKLKELEKQGFLELSRGKIYIVKNLEELL